eukprot:gene580-859_t
MGKKKDRLLKKAEQDTQIPWQLIDADPLRFLIAPEDPDTFFAKHWEQQPAVFKATSERTALVQGLCSFPAVVNWLKQRQQRAGPLEFGVDVNAARYKDGVRETPNGEVADAETLQTLHSSEGCTLQLHQPQRFFDPCWRLLAALERQMGCLVGSNSYHTPAGSQGLAPHHDDVELWVVQTAGTKSWRIYGPRNGYRLPNQPSGDLEQDNLGDPVLEVELSVGDVLYLPRGAVHQAVAAGSDSSHLTISTYQRSSYADLATHLLQVGLAAQDEPECLPLEARFSAAPGTLLQHSLHKVLAPGATGSTTPDAVSGLARALRSIADKLEATPDMMTAAVHSSAMEFLMNRLPPHPKQLPGRGQAPVMDSKLWCRVAGWSYLLPFEMTGMNCEDDEDEGELWVTAGREEHMISIPDEEESSEEEDEADDDQEGSDDDDASEDEPPAAAGTVAAGSDSQGGGGGADDEAPASDDGGDADNHKSSGGKGAKAAAGRQLDGEGEGHGHGQCCGDDGCHHSHGHGVQEHSLSSGAGEKENPVAALPGLVLAPGMVKAVVAFMAAETPDKAVSVRDLPLPSDGAKLQLAFALWAEGLASVLPGSKDGSSGQHSRAKAAGDAANGSKSGNSSKPAAGKKRREASTDGQEGTATSNPNAKQYSGKKAKV